MPEGNEEVVDKAAAAQGVTPADLDPAEGRQGNPAPPPPPNEPPKPDPTPEEKAAAEKAAADQAAADKAAADAKAAAEAENKPLDNAVWGTTGDEVGDSVLTLLQNSGLSVEDAKAMMFDAVRAGDPTKIDRAALEAKIGKDKAVLVLAGADNFIKRSAEKAAVIVKEVHTAVGGEDNWKQVIGWANKAVPENELAEYRDLIDAGGAKARFAAQDLATRYNADAKNTTLDAGKTDLTGDSKAVTSGRTLSKADYVAEMEAAHNKNASPAVINEIKAARARGRAAGI